MNLDGPPSLHLSYVPSGQGTLSLHATSTPDAGAQASLLSLPQTLGRNKEPWGL